MGTLSVRDSRSGRGALGLLVAAFLAACGPSPQPSPSSSPAPVLSRPGVTATPAPTASKSLALFDRFSFIGWIDGAPAVGFRDATAKPPNWQVQTLGNAGWHAFGVLPDGTSPVTDGVTIAIVDDPETGPDIVLTQAGGATRNVTLPAASWVESWRGIHGLVPIIGRSGYLLVGAGAIATVDDEGGVRTMPIPAGYVALAPTSDPERFLLASKKDASEPLALSEASRFAVYLWEIGSDKEPTVLRQDFVASAPSTIGLVSLRSADGSWWSVTDSGAIEQISQPSAEASSISPDGRQLVRFSDAVSICDQASVDPCPVSLIDRTGSTQTFVGPASGRAGFAGADIGFVLLPRPSLHLTWRLVHGPADAPTTTSLE
jgi:hypothetical protein